MIGSAIGFLVMALFLATLISVGNDFATYSTRQDEWEREHPGATYIRGYRRLSEAEREARS